MIVCSNAISNSYPGLIRVNPVLFGSPASDKHINTILNVIKSPASTLRDT